jgi:hypothetical protein
VLFLLLLLLQFCLGSRFPVLDLRPGEGSGREDTWNASSVEGNRGASSSQHLLPVDGERSDAVSIKLAACSCFFIYRW